MTIETTTTTTFKSIKVWINPRDSQEYRVYVTMLDGREGCRYITGNAYHAAKSVDGQLTDAEWKEARRLAYVGKAWTTVYFTPAPWEKKQTEQRNVSVRSTRQRCPDCGGYDCGGGNCTSNRW